ncbi:MAG: glycosyltransferase [Actinobacteria bacterium]|nr:glycosyltransferase [Actinomycetota bacterium]MBU1609350.1 glycosyltransferase [Actinomycetota bacterium]MBU2314982.1 glycosyltransferase [Actinomycetota bacterium]MBU2385052.1 glycosyltransferase [Actinomycetota bacterium]
MRVVVVSHSAADHLGGAEQSLLTLLDQWTVEDTTVEPLVIGPTPSAAMTREVVSRGWRAVDMPMTGWAVWEADGGRAQRRLREVQNAAATRRIIALLEHEQPDLVITNTLVMPWGALAAAQVGVPHAWFVREFGERRQGFIFPDGRDSALHDIGTLSCAVVANSRAVAEALQPHMPDHDIRVVYPPVDLARVRELAREPAERAFGETGALRVAVLGRVTHSKGQWRVIEALGRLDAADIEVRFIGGVLDAHADVVLLRRAQALGVTADVQFLGERANPFPLVAQAHLCVIPSEKEPFGRSTLECLALGKPVITTRAGAGAELVDHDRTGALVDSDDFGAWALTLRRYVDDRALAERQGQASRRRADEIASGPHSAAVAIAAMVSVAAGTPAAVPERWRTWMDDLEAIASASARGLVTRARLTRAGRLALRAARHPVRAARRLRALAARH